MENTEQSGGTRFNSGKPGMWWAVPMYGLRAVARVTMLGSKKYAPKDWACGQSYSTLLDSASRHWIEVLTDGPLARDEESGLLHLAHCAWNILCLLHFIEQGREDLDDVSKWTGVTTAMKNAKELDEAHPPGTIVQCERPMMSNRPIWIGSPSWADREAEVSRSPGAERIRQHTHSTIPESQRVRSTLADRVRE